MRFYLFSCQSRLEDDEGSIGGAPLVVVVSFLPGFLQAHSATPNCGAVTQALASKILQIEYSSGFSSGYKEAIPPPR